MTPRRPIVPPSICICGESNCKTPYGLCHCGCKQKTPLSKETCLKKKLIRGLPTRYVPSHNRWVRGMSKVDEPTGFTMNGVKILFIPLSKNQYAVIDEIDYPKIRGIKWYAWWNDKTRTFYAAGTLNGENVYMHRVILGLEKGNPLEGDHINPWATIDNRRINLRPGTRFQNCANTRKRRTSKSGLKGVTWHEKARKWMAMITVYKKRIYLGLFETPEEAHEAYCQAAVKYYGEFARFA